MDSTTPQAGHEEMIRSDGSYSELALSLALDRISKRRRPFNGLEITGSPSFCFSHAEACEFGLPYVAVKETLCCWMFFGDWKKYNLASLLDRDFPYLTPTEVSDALILLQEQGLMLVKPRPDGLIDIRWPQHEAMCSGIQRTAQRPKETPGYVYLMHCSSGLYKIGKATSPDKRLVSLQKQCGMEMSIVATVFVHEPLRMEAEIHAEHSNKRCHGEWFALEMDDVSSILSVFESHSSKASGRGK